MNFDIFPPIENMTLDNLNHFIRNIRINGQEPEGIVMHYKQYFELSNILASQQRYMDTRHDVNGITLCTYQGIPIYSTNFNDGYQCKVCGSGAATAFISKDQRLVFCCKEHQDRAQMFVKMEG